jgi:cold shock CspA family protein
MSTVNNITIDATRAMAIINSRLPISRQHINQQVVLQVQGSGTYQSATEQEARTPGRSQYFDQYIHNLKANSTEAMGRAENKAILKAAMEAEAAGNSGEASKLFNDYLNAIQVSFSVISRSGVRKLEDGDMVTCVVEEADTKAGHKALVVSNVRYKAPAAVEKVKFSITDLLGEVAAPAEALADTKVVTTP